MSRDKACGWLESWCDVEVGLAEALGKDFRVSVAGQVQSFMEWWEKQQAPRSTAQMCCGKHSPLSQITGRTRSRCWQTF